MTDGLSESSKIFKRAKSSAEKHPKAELPAFSFTEERPEWVLLYDLARQGQITPKIMKNMRRSDLYYLAGHAFPHPALTQPRNRQSGTRPAYEYVGLIDDPEERWSQATKLQGNAVRAKAELERRNFIWSSSLVILAALAGGFLGSGIWK